MSKKIALQGFDRLSIFPVIKNDADSYEVGAKISIYGAQEMTRDNDVSEQKYYADDGVYLYLKQFNGIQTKLTLLEMPFETMETLGFGNFDAQSGVFSADPQGKNKEFALSFRCLNAAGEYRMYKFFSFTVTEIRESAAKTKGKDPTLGSYEIVGMFGKRRVDDKTYVMKDGEAEESAFLDLFEKVGA